jgi:hypothetical protein
MNSSSEDTLFEQAPSISVQRRLGLVKPDKLDINRRALLSVLVAWVPLILFAALQSIMAREDEIGPMLREVGLHARYLVAVPLLVLAEAACAPQLSAIVRHFADSGVVCEGDRRRFQDAIASTRRLLLSSTAEIVVVVLAYLVVGAPMLSHPADELPAWAKPVSITPYFSLAAWWHLLVSLSLLLILIFGWFWRLALLWARLKVDAQEPNTARSQSGLDKCLSANG